MTSKQNAQVTTAIKHSRTYVSDTARQKNDPLGQFFSQAAQADAYN